MFLRSLGATLAAARVFSTKAAKVTTLGLATEKKGAGGRDTLGRRLLSLVYAKRSAAITMRKWKEEGHTVHKYELNRIVRELRKLKRYKHALEVCIISCFFFFFERKKLCLVIVILILN